MSARKLWGEIEPEECDDELFQNVDFSQMIELTMHQIPDIPSTIKPTIVNFPIDNVVKHTIELHEYARTLTDILDKTENANAEGTQVETTNIPPRPPTPPINDHHKFRAPINFVDKDPCDFSLGKGPVVVPLKHEEHKRAMQQCASLALAHLGVYASTQTTVNVLSDALDHYLWTLTQLMRTYADREAGNLHCGFPDIVSKTFSEMRITNLKDFYRNRVINYREKVRKECIELADAIQEALQAPAQQLKLEEVPELHFPAALSEVLTPSLEPGFQMLHSLEQEELQGLELLDTAHDDIKIEVVEYGHNTHTSDLASPSLSPRNKKKRKL